MKEKKEKKGLSKNLLLILAVPLLVAVGVVAGNYISGDNTQVVSGNEIEEVAEVNVPLEEFLLNLAPSENRNHYMRLEVSVSTKKEGGAELINANLDKIRDTLIHTVSRLTVDEVYNNESGTNRLKDVLRTALNDVFEEENVIHDVYITNIVVQ